MPTDADYTEAVVRRGRKISVIWLVPLVALVISVWMVFIYLSGQGPLIEINFESAEGIEAGKSKIKMKNVVIGEVLDLQLSRDAEHVVVSARIEKNGAHLLREDSRFWIVKPRIGKGGVSGLNTLLSGAYIELSPGSEKDRSKSFTGLEAPPITPAGTPGLHVTLDSDSNRSLSEGDPVLFHGTPVGSIEFVHFNTEERRNYYNAFIAAPFDSLITSNTRFWFVSGIGAEISADGVRVEMASLATVIGGGVAFDVPDGLPQGARITERAFFTIYPRQNAINAKHYKQSLTFAILFKDSIRGLRPGAPVEYRGIKIGRVVRTDIDYPQMMNLLNPESKIPVLIEIVPARLGYEDSKALLGEVSTRIAELIAEGLHASLATGNLLTGSKYVVLQYHDDTPDSVRDFSGYVVIPSIDGQLGQIMHSVATTLDTINKLPLDKVVGSAKTALDEVSKTLVIIRKSAAELDEILADPSSHALVNTLNTTLSSIQRLAIDFSEGSSTHHELEQSLKSLDQTLKELEPVFRNLRHKPNSLIFGSDEIEDLEPKGIRQ